MPPLTPTEKGNAPSQDLNDFNFFLPNKKSVEGNQNLESQGVILLFL